MNIANTVFKILQHKFEIENSDGSKEIKTSTLCEYGAPTGSGGYSAMAKLVGIPCGVGKSSCYIASLLKFRYFFRRQRFLTVRKPIFDLFDSFDLTEFLPLVYSENN